MKISELKDKQKGVNMDLKIIFDRMPSKQAFGRKTKTVVVVDADSESGGESALLDLFDDDIDNYKFKDKLKVVNGYSKKIKTSRGEQFLITYGCVDDKLIGHYEKIE